MARKHNRTGRSRNGSRFVMLEHFMLNSPAWRSLSLAGRAAYIEIAARYSPGNNGRIAVSGRMLADSLSVSRQTANRSLVELVERGFVEAVRLSGFNLKSGERRATEWRLTGYKCDVTGDPPSQKFMRWQGGQIHFTASPESHTGLTRGPLKATAKQYFTKVALS